MNQWSIVLCRTKRNSFMLITLLDGPMTYSSSKPSFSIKHFEIVWPSKLVRHWDHVTLGREELLTDRGLNSEPWNGPWAPKSSWLGIAWCEKSTGKRKREWAGSLWTPCDLCAKIFYIRTSKENRYMHCSGAGGLVRSVAASKDAIPSEPRILPDW